MLAPSTTIGFEKAGEEQVERPVVLVIEDYPAIQKVLSHILYLQGYQPICAINGQQALEWIENAFHAKQYPAAILLDLFMPVMDGTAFLACLRARWNAPIPIPPTILLTVDQGNHDHLECTEVLPKPFHIKELLERLQRVLNEE